MTWIFTLLGCDYITGSPESYSSYFHRDQGLLLSIPGGHCGRPFRFTPAQGEMVGLGEGGEQVRLSSSPLHVSCFEDPPGLGFAMGQQPVPLVGQGSPPGLLGIPSGPRGEASSLLSCISVPALLVCLACLVSHVLLTLGGQDPVSPTEKISADWTLELGMWVLLALTLLLKAGRALPRQAT